MIDLDKIEALAKAATPGPWIGDRIDGTVKYDIVAGDYPNGAYTVICHGDNGNACDGGYGFTSAENEAYALAANPAAILALVAEVRAWRTRFPGHVHRPQDECIALRMWLDRDEMKPEYQPNPGQTKEES